MRSLLRLLATTTLVAVALVGCASASGPAGPEPDPTPSATAEPPVTAAAEAPLFSLESIDGTTWCSPHRGDCLEIALPVITAFGGSVAGDWPPQPADPDGCFRLRGGGSYDLWFCPAGAAADMSSRPTDLDDDRTDVDRLIVKFKATDGWVYLKA
ncbi:MAG TPA: hypothetical protein VNQ52_07325 [Microbacteriaceae bacterium]|nr:hypothetical protein [Microbacteriaceae bacterium]